MNTTSRGPSDRPSVRVESTGANPLVDDIVCAGNGADSLPDLSYKLQPLAATTPPPDLPTKTNVSSVPRTGLGRLRSELSERDQAIIRFVNQFRYVRGDQLIRMFFGRHHGHASNAAGARSASSVLTRLVATSALRRTERRIGGIRAGSGSYVYGLGSVGHRLTHSDGSRGRWDEPSPMFLDHTLAITELAVKLHEAEQGHDPTPPTSVQTVLQPVGVPRSSAASSLTIEAEPRCWRSFQLGLGGKVVLKPDLFVRVEDGDYEDHWFIEIDLSTESSTALLRKCQIYIDYFRSGNEQHRTGIFPRVLWIVPTDKRQRQIDGIIRKLKLPTAATELFAVTTTERAVDVIRAGGQP